MDVKIRIATSGDLKSIQGLNHELCKKEYENFDQTINPDWPLRPEGRTYFEERINKGFAFVATAGKEVVGYAVGGLVNPELYRNGMMIAELENMIVLEKYRSAGTGTKLVDAFFDWCKRMKVNRVRVVVSAQNSRAIDFYRRNGFENYNACLERNL